MPRVNPVGTGEGPDNPSGVNAVGSRHHLPSPSLDEIEKEHGPYAAFHIWRHGKSPPRETCEASADSPGLAHLRGATGQLIEFMLLHGPHGGAFIFDSDPDVLRLYCYVCDVNVQVLRSSLVHPSGEMERAQASGISQHPARAETADFPTVGARCKHCEYPLTCDKCGLPQ